jgi:hypothetical protein
VISLAAAAGILRRIPAEVWVGLLLIGALTVWTWRWYDAGHEAARAAAAAEIAAFEAEIAELKDANEGAVALVRTLQETNRELAEGRAADQEAAAIAVAELRRDRDALAKELERRRTDRGVIYERDESAAAWAAARVPDAVARSLRE